MSDMSDAPKKLSILAVVSCVLGIGGIVMLTPLGSFAQSGIEEGLRNVLVLPVTAVIVGLIALRRTRKGSGRKGRVIASLGLVFGGGVMAVIVTYLGLLLSVRIAARPAADVLISHPDRCRNSIVARARCPSGG